MSQDIDNTKPDAPNANTQGASKQGASNKTKTWLVYTLLLLLLTAGLFSFARFFGEEKQIEILTREAVVDKVQTLSRLETVVFSIDTIITTKREGNWYALYQDAQKGLFVAHGKVVAGVDFAKLTAENVRLINTSDKSNVQTTKNTEPNKTMVAIDLPAVEVFSVYLDDIEVYDIQSGLLGLIQTDGNMYAQAQAAGKAQVLEAACDAGVLKTANDNAIKQVKALFELTKVDVRVKSGGVAGCH